MKDLHLSNNLITFVKMNDQIKQLIEKIEENKKENYSLRLQIENEINAKYQKYIGKYFKTYRTSVDYIFGIDYIDSYSIVFETISVYGCSDESFEVKINYDELSLRFEEVEEYFESKEITKEEYLAFVEKAFENSKENLLKACE